MSGTNQAAEDPDAPIIEIEDDTPSEDRGRPRAGDEIDSDIPTDEELEAYAPSTRSRISKLRLQYHAERRSRESAERQNQEAVRLVKHLQGELTRTRGFARDRDKEALTGARSTVESQLAQARRDVTEAFTNGDTEKFGEANERVARLAAASERLKTVQPMIPDEEVIQQQDRQSFGGMRGDAQSVAEIAASPDAKAVAWGARNPWFGKDNRMTSLAYGIHADLVQEGRVEVGSDAYYNALDTELRRAAPAAFRGEDDRPARREQRSPPARSAPAASSVMSSGGRSSVASGGRRIVRITQSQADIARKLGVSNEQYVAELMKLETE